MLPQTYTRHIVDSQLALACPHCSSIIYSRRSKLCGVCAEPLPPNYLFNPAQAIRVEQLLRDEQERFRHWRRRELDASAAASYNRTRLSIWE